MTTENGNSDQGKFCYGGAEAIRGQTGRTASGADDDESPCPSCNGTGDGGIPRGPGYSFACPACGGRGIAR